MTKTVYVGQTLATEIGSCKTFWSDVDIEYEDKVDAESSLRYYIENLNPGVAVDVRLIQRVWTATDSIVEWSK